MWFNKHALTNEHAKFKDIKSAHFKYTTVEHSSGEVSITAYGKKSGLQTFDSCFRSIREYVEQGASLKVVFDFKQKDAFPELKCGRCPYLTHRTSIEIADPEYLAHALQVVSGEYDIPASLSSLFSQMIEDWLNLEQDNPIASKDSDFSKGASTKPAMEGAGDEQSRGEIDPDVFHEMIRGEDVKVSVKEAKLTTKFAHEFVDTIQKTTTKHAPNKNNLPDKMEMDAMFNGNPSRFKTPLVPTALSSPAPSVIVSIPKTAAGTHHQKKRMRTISDRRLSVFDESQ